jgi:hypothetical protein
MNAPTTPKTYHVKSFGCQMNVYDGERMAELMATQGSTPATSAKRRPKRSIRTSDASGKTPASPTAPIR